MYTHSIASVLLLAGVSNAWVNVLNPRQGNDVDACAAGDMTDATFNGKTYCCPGKVDGSGDSAYCCVGEPVVSFASCFPFCTSTQTISSSFSCSTTIPLKIANYAQSACNARSLTGGDASASCPTPSGTAQTSGSDNAGVMTTGTTGAVQTGSNSGNAAMPVRTAAAGVGMGIAGVVAAMAL